MALKTKINGKEASWSHIRFTFLEAARRDISEIKYSDSLEAENNYTVGPLPTGYSTGKYEAALEMKMSLAGWEQIEQKATHGIYALEPFDVVVSYKVDRGATRTDTIPGVKILSAEIASSSGDKNAIMVPVKFLVTGVIKWDGKPALREE